MKDKEFSIMPNNIPYWSNTRFEGSHRHEVMYGTSNRKKSIEDGLIIFLKPEQHNMSKKGIHFNREYDLIAKRSAQARWCEYYEKTTEDWIERYGRNYL